jgi:hypothetical protein
MLMIRILAFSVISIGLAEAATLTTADGNITVTSAVTSIGGGLFQYNYTVADLTGELIDLDIAVTPGVPISGIATPGGNAFEGVISTVGSGSTEQEFVSFLENLGTFSSTPTPGFIFDSPVPAGPSTFGVTLVDSTTGTMGGIQGPVTPEPASLALCAVGCAGLLFWRKQFNKKELK